jgi:hypothetical protein
LAFPGASEVNLHFINITPTPIFAWLDRLDDGMLRRMEMLGGVLILGRIAAAHVAAGFADSQVDPCVAHFQAFLAAMSSRLDVVDLIEMCACACHVFSFS